MLYVIRKYTSLTKRKKIGFTEERNQLKEFVSFRTAKRMLRSKLQMTLSLRRVRRSTYQMERSKGETKKVSAGRTTVVVENTKEDKTVYHAGTKDGVQALIRAVVVTKSIKNEIMWDKITKLFPNNSLDNLKKEMDGTASKNGS